MAILQDALIQAKSMLGHPTVRSVQLDAQVLLCHVLAIKRAMLYAYPEREITSQQEVSQEEGERKRTAKLETGDVIGYKI